jgi:AcrR family transcriptional regulator
VPRPRSDIRPRLLRAARELFLVYGVDGASLRDIAREADTNIGMIYYYFSTKDDLFEAVVGELFPRVVERVSAALAPDAPMATRFERMFVNISKLQEDELVTVRLIIREILVSSERRLRVLALAQKAHFPIILGALFEGLGSGQLSKEHHPGVLAISLFGAAFFAQVVRRLAGDGLPKELEVPAGEDLARALAHLWLHGSTPR